MNGAAAQGVAGPSIGYLLPLRCEAVCPPGVHAELSTYLAGLGSIAEVMVVDGSSPAVFRVHRGAFGALGHVPVDTSRRSANGKVDGVLTGLSLLHADAVVIADEDVRYDTTNLRAAVARLERGDLVIPQNIYRRPMPWYASWDTARIAMNRAFTNDYPGTVVVRRTAVLALGGYDGDVLFENLELMRTVRAGGGTVVAARDVYVDRLAPTLRRFCGQRVQQAYDSLGQPARLTAELALLPFAINAAARGRWRDIATAAAAAMAIAELGRQRDGGAAHLPPSVTLLAPAWLAERAVCAWLAVGARVALGGFPYRGVTIRRAATPMRELRRRRRSSAAMRHGSRRIVASSAIARTGTAARSLA